MGSPFNASLVIWLTWINIGIAQARAIIAACEPTDPSSRTTAFNFLPYSNSSAGPILRAIKIALSGIGSEGLRP